MKTTTTATMPLPDVASDRMKALVYRGPGKRAWENRPKPTITQATDAVVKITTSTICGTDLHILKGDVPSVAEGRILGHEGVGVVETVGSAVTSFVAGDRVLISCITACGKCEYLQKGDVLALSVRWMDSRQHDRRDAGRIRANSSRRHKLVSRAR